jgi:glycosyltransferase involved in cell wall biosynthesis
VVHPKAQILPSCPKDNLVTIHNFNQYDPIAILKLRHLINTKKPDCIITHSYRAAYLLKKTKTKVPTIAVCHAKGHYDFGSDAIIAITEHMRQDIIRSGIPAHTVFTVPNMIDIPEEHSFRAPKTSSIPVIGVCARLADIKGVDLFIEALAELKQRQVPFTAKIAGDGPDRARCEALISKHHLQSEVTLLGWVDDRPSFYQSLDIFCLPSREEAFGLVILESMMQSLPMVLPKLPGPLEIVADSDCALFFTPADAKQMADALQQLMNDKNKAAELAANAYQRVSYYSSQHIGQMLHQVLEQVCLMPAR